MTLIDDLRELGAAVDTLRRSIIEAARHDWRWIVSLFRRQP